MDEIEALVNFSELKIDYLKFLAEHKIIQPILDFDAEVDMLIVLYAPGNQDFVAHYVDDYFASLYYAENLEVIGFQVENFTFGFVPKYPNVEAVWHGVVTTDVIREIFNAVGDDLGDYRDTFVALVA